MIMLIIILIVIIFILVFKINNQNKINKNLKRIILKQIQKEKNKKIKNQFFLEKKKQEEKISEYKKSKEYKLDLVKKCSIFSKDKLMGIGEFLIYKELIFCEDIKNNFIVFPQISLKSFLKDDKEDEVWKAYSDLVVDFLFVIKDFKNKSTKPFAVLEFQGGGHYGDKSDIIQMEKIKKNDEIKKEVILKAKLHFYVLEGAQVYQDNSYFIDDLKLKKEIKKIADSLYLKYKDLI
ncbi:DUF2726 domain-containing protein [Campylobacter novaezeelandiae]|uniref:DUF2726 domain-containing protein n=1 Tax=Campylobacter novaezeelandiae TaxID=2267891 RepID=UPI0010374E02|nr:DUF2726 domain-containing protein [Campylobacter novaezeelandiae]QWU79453.1 DUF2726 domain-containing protein [Campylobacter novaezeelandiae]TBR78161.1 DUF2726 domain-containing protein [Campylobacter novaezeelandiae]TBR80246.1 DUF2726 domain-containing protein [Campylobacter novaezeelandiae]